MYTPETLGGRPLVVLGSSLTAILTLAGCAAEQRARYEGLQLELRGLEPSSAQAGEDDDPFAGRDVLERSAVVDAVLARNPSIDAARYAWRAALAEFPQVTSLDDPTVSTALAPFTLASADVNPGVMARVGQRFPFPGKLDTAGAVELAEAEAARGDFHATRLNLALVASLVFFNMYEVREALRINDEHIELLKELRESAKAQFAAGRASLEDAVQAEVELAHLEHRRIVLDTRLDVLRAQLNALLRRPARASLPPLPNELPRAVSLEVEDEERLLEIALESRPELLSAKARIEAAEKEIELAKLQYWPDVGVEGQFNSMWARPEHWFSVGASVNVPLWLERRAAGVEEAEARRGRMRSVYERALLDTREEVETAKERLEEARHVLRLHEERLVPAAKAQLEAAVGTFTSGKGSFLSVIEAERNVRITALGVEEATAQLHRRVAQLERALGRLPEQAGGDVIPPRDVELPLAPAPESAAPETQQQGTDIPRDVPTETPGGTPTSPPEAPDDS